MLLAIVIAMSSPGKEDHGEKPVVVRTCEEEETRIHAKKYRRCNSTVYQVRFGD